MGIYVFISFQALEEKEKGNTAYKKRDFTAALEHYDKAIELDPTNVTFLTNKSGRSITLHEHPSSSS